MTLQTTKETPKVVKLLMGALDYLAAAGILAFAIMGVERFLNLNLDWRIKTGLAVCFVGLLASRLVERAFQARR